LECKNMEFLQNHKHNAKLNFSIQQ